MKVGIAVDDWKVPVFEKRLTEAGYKFDNRGAVAFNSVLLTVETKNPSALRAVVEQCQAECARSKLN